MTVAERERRLGHNMSLLFSKTNDKPTLEKRLISSISKSKEGSTNQIENKTVQNKAVADGFSTNEAAVDHSGKLPSIKAQGDY